MRFLLASYRLSAQVISRKAGRNAVESAAYRAAERLVDERRDKTFNYSRKGGVEHTEIMVPKGAPDWASDRGKLWSNVELAERRFDSQLAREVLLSLPVELNNDQQLELLRSFVQRSFVNDGMVADIAVHRSDPGNPHAHVMLTMRDLEPDGFGDKHREWNHKNNLKEWRASWADEQNAALFRAGAEDRVDHRSYADRGLEDLEPEPHIGAPKAKEWISKKAAVIRRAGYRLDTRFRNGVRLQKKPHYVTKALTDNRSSFREQDIRRFVEARTFDNEQTEQVMAAVMKSEDLVKLPEQRGQVRFTSAELVGQEKAFQDHAQALMKRKRGVGSRHVKKALSTRTLSEEQGKALQYLADSKGLALIEGRAGTGKSYMLGAAREMWESQGYEVLGAALSGKAADGLKKEAGIESRSLAGWEVLWKNGRKLMDRKSVLVIDEAAMVGSRQMNRLLEQAEKTGAKVVLVGDTQQIQAIEAGAPMRVLREKHGGAVLSEIRRQKVEWQRVAAMAMSDGKTAEGLKEYDRRGMLTQRDSADEARSALVEKWWEDRKDFEGSTSLMLAWTRADTGALNDIARDLRKAGGELTQERMVSTEDGPKGFAPTDRLYFLKNDRELGVKNGTLGTVERIRGSRMTVKIDGGETVTFDTKKYDHITHGYAATLTKGQGVTADRSYVLATDSFGMDAHGTYVALTRQKFHAQVFYAKEQFENSTKLIRHLSRERPKEMATELLEERPPRKRQPRTPQQEANQRLREFLKKPPAEQNAQMKQLAEIFSKKSEGEDKVLRTDLDHLIAMSEGQKAQEALTGAKAELKFYNEIPGEAHRPIREGCARRVAVLRHDLNEAKQTARAAHSRVLQQMSAQAPKDKATIDKRLQAIQEYNRLSTHRRRQERRTSVQAFAKELGQKRNVTVRLNSAEDRAKWVTFDSYEVTPTGERVVVVQRDKTLVAFDVTPAAPKSLEGLREMKKGDRLKANERGNLVKVPEKERGHDRDRDRDRGRGGR